MVFAPLLTTTAAAAAADTLTTGSEYSTPSRLDGGKEEEGGVQSGLANGNDDARRSTAAAAAASGGISPGGDEKQEVDGGDGAKGRWGLSATSVVEVGEYGDDNNNSGGRLVPAFDEEAGVVRKGRGGGEGEVVEVLLDAGDALTAKEALLQVGVL